MQEWHPNKFRPSCAISEWRWIDANALPAQRDAVLLLSLPTWLLAPWHALTD